MQKQINNSIITFGIQDTLVIKGLALIILLACHLFGRSEAAWSLFKYFPALMVDGKPLITALTSAGCGKVCVDIFVILSGFGLNESYLAKYGESCRLTDTILFSVRRIVKLLLGFWCVFLVFGGAFAAIGKIDLVATYGTGKDGLIAFVVDFYGLRDILFEITHTGTINATWWYISAILCYYCLFPVFRYLVSRKHNVFPLLLLLIINVTAPNATYRQFSTGVFFYLSAFYLGMLCSEYKLLDKLKSLGADSYWERLFCSIVAVVIGYLFTYSDRYRGELFLAVALMVLFVTLFVEPKGILNKNSIRKGLETMGQHSSNIFMFHTFFLLKYSDIVYLFKYPFLVLFSFTLAMMSFSVLLEFAKKKLGITKLIKKI